LKTGQTHITQTFTNKSINVHHGGTCGFVEQVIFNVEWISERVKDDENGDEVACVIQRWSWRRLDLNKLWQYFTYFGSDHWSDCISCYQGQITQCAVCTCAQEAASQIENVKNCYRYWGIFKNWQAALWSLLQIPFFLYSS